MYLGGGSSKYYIEEKNEEIMDETPGKMAHIDANKDGSNGEMGSEDSSNPNPTPNFPIGPIGSPSFEPKVNEDGIANKQEREPSPKSIASSSNSNLEVNSIPTKGFGWRKVRRIRRYLNKDASSRVDALSLIMKKKQSLNESLKARDDNIVVGGELETPTPSVGSFHLTQELDAVALDPELVKLMASGGFSIGMDLDNSEDQSSKSSIAATVPKTSHEIGFGRERGRSKNVGGKGIRNVMQQRAQGGRGSGVDVSEKIRGDKIGLEKKNSQSSIEFNLRSPNVGFMRWGSGVCNGSFSGKSLNFDEENGNGVQTCEKIRSRYHTENGLVKDVSREDFHPDLSQENEAKRENFQPSSGIDPFIESIVMLQAVQETLEMEIKKFGELGKVSDHVDRSNQSDTGVGSSPTLEAHSLELNQEIEHLQYKLEEALATVDAKESEVQELEVIVKDSLILDDMHGFEFELENLLMAKIRAEVEFIIITRAIRSRKKISADDQISVLEERTQMMLKMRNAEDKAIKLKQQAEKLESNCKGLLETETVIKMKNKICKFGFCCFMQLLLLFLAFGLFLNQLPTSDDFVPT